MGLFSRNRNRTSCPRSSREIDTQITGPYASRYFVNGKELTPNTKVILKDGRIVVLKQHIRGSVDNFTAVDSNGCSIEIKRKEIKDVVI